MSFIQRLGSKQYPVPKRKSERKDIPVVLKVDVSNIEDKVAFTLIGENLNESYEYEWVVDFGNKTIKPNTIGTTLILTKKNTELFNTSKVVTVHIKHFSKETFIVKDDTTNVETVSETTSE